MLRAEHWVTQFGTHTPMTSESDPLERRLRLMLARIRFHSAHIAKDGLCTKEALVAEALARIPINNRELRNRPRLSG